MELLQRGARELGLDLTAEQLHKFALYQAELLEWNSRFNLTAITDTAGTQVKHFLDSLTCLLVLARRQPDGSLDIASLTGRAIDVGSGAGFPGLALRIVCPNLRLTLVESVRKKAGFLSHMAATLGFANVEVVSERAEDLARKPGYRDAYDIGLARALAPLPVLVEYCLPFVRPGGTLVAPKKGDIGAEITAARQAVVSLGGRWRETLPVTSSLLTDGRILVVVDKILPTPKAYPRKAGVPAKQPLGSR